MMMRTIIMIMMVLSLSLSLSLQALLTFNTGVVHICHAYTTTTITTTTTKSYTSVYPTTSTLQHRTAALPKRQHWNHRHPHLLNNHPNTAALFHHSSVMDAAEITYDDENDNEGNDVMSVSSSSSNRNYYNNNNNNNNNNSNQWKQQLRTRMRHLVQYTNNRVRFAVKQLSSIRRNRFHLYNHHRSLFMTAALAFTILFNLSSSYSPVSTLPSVQSSSSSSSSSSTATTATSGNRNKSYGTQSLLLASSTTANTNTMHDAAVSYVQRGGTASTSTSTSTTSSTTGNWLQRRTSKPKTTSMNAIPKTQSTMNKKRSTTNNHSTPNQRNTNNNNNKNNNRNHHDNHEIVDELIQMERVVEHGVVVASEQTSKTFMEAIRDLHQYMSGPKSDTLLLLLATALITPLCQQVNLSPILGFLASGMIMGPNGFGIISGIHTTETLAELGIVFFLFEMGIELSFNRLKSMRRDVFGLGLAQFITTAVVVAGVGTLVGLPANANVVLGGGIALSSSAFVLQLLKDKNQLATRFGKASFGVLLFQDLAVVPLLVVTPILAGSGAGLASALSSALIKAAMALSSIAVAGRYLLNPLFKLVAQAQSQEAFLGVVLLTVLSMSFMTEGLGLSNTLGAFLAGVLLSETKYRYQVEADIAPFRGILLGLFFVTVGFEIDVKLIASNLPLVGSLVFGIIGIKAAITTALSLAFGLSLATSQQTGLMLSQGGEFAFVAFGLARSLGILDKPTTKLMLTSVSLTMALTPLMSTLGSKIAKRLEEQTDATHYLGQDRDANEIKESDDFTVVVGYGIVGKVVCDLLDRKFLRYVGLEIDPNRAIQARNAGLPVFYGDIGRQEVAEAFNVGKANAVVVCIADKAQTNRVVIALRRWYPELPIFARAVNADHAKRLQDTLNVAAMVPILPTDNILLTLPFGSAVMKSIGVPPEEVNAIVENKRKEVINMRGSNREEEELELLQLGISSDTLKDTSGFTALSQDDSLDEEERYDEQYEMTTEAAWERRKAIEEKSPFVARVIQEVCPESADDDDDEEDNNSNNNNNGIGTNGVNGEKIATDVMVDVEYTLVNNNNNRTIAVSAE